jgi:hypothetical protein
LQDHPVLEILHVEGFQSLDGIDDLLSSKKSQVKELVIEKFSGSLGNQLVGFEYSMKEMGRNTTILKMAIVSNVPLSRNNVQQHKAMLRQNTVLQDLNLSQSELGCTGLAEIAPVLYRNTSIKYLDLSANGLHTLARVCLFNARVASSQQDDYQPQYGLEWLWRKLCRRSLHC